jgi:hypothetical protein
MIIWIALLAQICNDILQISMIFLTLKFYVAGFKFWASLIFSACLRFGVTWDDARWRNVCGVQVCRMAYGLPTIFFMSRNLIRRMFKM